ncbi:MAG: type II toxin-antitoxin system VapC family toxin [Alphaproteobacteria bacterium]|nr:type II toxin-antitoxin system VapC family toxin [Alphaproteobacteria bacterium]
MKRGAILLDTCACIWIMNDEWMRAEAVEAVDEASDRGEKVFVSPITALEIGTSARKRRFRSPHAPQRWLELLLARPQIALAQMSAELLLESAFLPGLIETDPADRIIAATARQYGFTVMTRDRSLLDYGREGYLSVLEC